MASSLAFSFEPPEIAFTFPSLLLDSSRLSFLNLIVKLEFLFGLGGVADPIIGYAQPVMSFA